MFGEICRNAEKCHIQSFEWGEVAWLHEPDSISGQRLSAGLVKFYPGKNQKQHTHFGEEQILFVIEGSGIQILNGKRQEIREGMLVHCPPFSEHEVVNSGHNDLVFLITYTPSTLMEAPQKVPGVKGRRLQQLIEPEILNNLQNQLQEMLGLSIKITDSSLSAGNMEATGFCSLAIKEAVCGGQCGKTGDASTGKDSGCCFGIMQISVPIQLGDEIPGIINSGCFLINKPEKYKEIMILKLSEKFKDTKELEEVIAAYEQLPLITRSRYYALMESMEAASRIISGIIENNLMEKEKLDLESALKQANLRLMKQKLFSGTGGIIGGFLTKKSQEYPIALEEELSAAIKKLDSAAVRTSLIKLNDDFMKRELPENVVKDMVSEMLSSLSRLVYKESGDENTFLEIRYKYRARLEGCSSLQGFEKLLLDLSDELTGILRNTLQRGSHGAIQKVNRYIKNNYNQDINLNSLAELFYISPNYLSTLFNEKNGMNLKDYINKLRIEKAKEYLAETDMKISEISRKVGYSQMSYFGSVFKRLEQCTPNQWRARSSQIRE